MPRDFLVRRYRDLSAFLSGQFEAARNIDPLNPTDHGGELETLVRRFLADHLPWGCGVTSGYVVNADGVYSRQQDIIVYNRVFGAVLAVGDAYSILPIETVFATIEVKATVTTATLGDASNKAESVRQLSGTQLLVELATGNVADVLPYGASVFTGLFSFETDVSLTRLRDYVAAAAHIDHVCVLNTCNVVWIAPGSRQDQELVSLRTKRHDDPTDGTALFTPKGPDYCGLPLFLFLSELHDHIQRVWTSQLPFAPLNYLRWPAEGSEIEWDFPSPNDGPNDRLQQSRGLD